jgi:hypothetical protein
VSLGPGAVDEVDEHDRVVDHDPEQQQQADAGEGVEIAVGQIQKPPDPDEAQRDRRQDRERQHEALEQEPHENQPIINGEPAVPMDRNWGDAATGDVASRSSR